MSLLRGMFSTFSTEFSTGCATCFAGFRPLRRLALTRGYPVQGGRICLYPSAGTGEGRRAWSGTRRGTTASGRRRGVGEDGPPGVGGGRSRTPPGWSETAGPAWSERRSGGASPCRGAWASPAPPPGGCGPAPGRPGTAWYTAPNTSAHCRISPRSWPVDVHVHRTALQLQVEDAGGELAHHLLVFCTPSSRAAIISRDFTCRPLTKKNCQFRLARQQAGWDT